MRLPDFEQSYFNPDAPFRVASREFTELVEHFRKVFADFDLEASDAPQELVAHMLDVARAQGLPEQSSEYLRNHLENSFLIPDLLRFAREVLVQEDCIQPSKLTDPRDGRTFNYVSREIHQLLLRSRQLGLVPFSILDRIADFHIVCAGASVAASTLMLLGAYGAGSGAGNVTIVDAGNIDVSNFSRLPGSMADVRNLGAPKSKTVLNDLFGLNPYGNFSAYVAKVGIQEESTSDEIALGELIADTERPTDLLIEVIDNPMMKLQIREQVATVRPDLPILFIGDVKNVPVVGLEKAGDEQFFNQPFTREQWRKRVENLMTKSYPRNLYGAAGMVLDMFNPNQIPQSMLLQFFAASLQKQVNDGWKPFIPFWSQERVAANRSAALAFDVLKEYLGGNLAVVGSHYTDAEFYSEHGQKPEDLFQNALLHSVLTEFLES